MDGNYGAIVRGLRPDKYPRDVGLKAMALPTIWIGILNVADA